MASTWSALKIELLETGQNPGQWGNLTNINLGDAVLGEAITGQATVDFASDADVTITLTDSATTQAARNLRLNITESSTGVGSVRNLILGSNCQIEKFYLINNTGTGAKTVKNTSGTGISVPAGKATLVYNNGTNVVDAASYFTSLTLGSALPVASGGTGLTAGTSGGVLGYTATGTLASSVALTANALVLGAGAGATPTPMASLGTTTTVLHGNASGAPTFSAVSLTADVTGVLPTANGGTNLGGATPFTSGGVVYASSSSVLATGSALQFTGTSLLVGTTSATANFNFLATQATDAPAGLMVENTSNTASASAVMRYKSSGSIFAYTGLGSPSRSAYAGLGANILSMYTNGDAGISLSVDNAAGPITFNTNSAEKMRVTPAGNVGIGTSSPTSLLELNRTATNDYSAIRFSNSGAGGRTYEIGLGGNAAAAGFANNLYFYDATAALNRMTLDSAGNLGLGVTPSAWASSKAIEIAGGSLVSFGTGGLELWQNSYYDGSNSVYKNNGFASTYIQTSSQHRWSTAASGTAGNTITFTQAMTLDASGNLLVGTTTALARITTSRSAGSAGQVNGQIAMTHDGATTGYYISTIRGASTNEPEGLTFKENATERMRIDSSGNLLVGTTTATNSPNSSTSKFVVSGDFTGGFGQSITDTNTNTAVDHYMMSFNLGTAVSNQKGYIQFVGASGLILYATTSDQRLKTDLGVVTNTSVIDNLLIHDYTWKESGIAGRGVFAQEAYEVMPNAVGKGKDASDGSVNTPWGVDYSKFIPDLIVHAQQLKKQVQEQQALIQSLKARLDAANL